MPVCAACSAQLGEVDAPLSQVRLPAPDQQGAPPAEGEQVEVYSRLRDDSPLGWHTAVIKVGQPAAHQPEASRCAPSSIYLSSENIVRSQFET